MTLKFILLSVLICAIANSLKIATHQADTHNQVDDKQTIQVKFKKSDIQNVNSCSPDDEECEVEICPDTNIMKASYSCYSVIREQLDAWIQSANKKNPGSASFKIELACWQIDDQTDNGDDGTVSTRPQGGFKNTLYLCDINGQKPLHYHFA